MIADGVVDREGVTGLARHLAYSERHLHRQLLAELGAGPIALARAQRAQTARLLIQTSNLRLIDVAHAAGFSSVRQFNDTIKATYGRTPTELRHKSHQGRDSSAGADTVTVRLAYREPINWKHMLGYLDARAVGGVEEITNVAYRRTLRLPRGYGVAEMEPVNGHIQCKLRLQDIRDLTAAVQRSRRLLDLDTDTNDVDEHLQTDSLLGPLVRNSPGLRVPGAVDGAELAVRAVLGQQVSVAAARTTASRLTNQLGDTLPVADGTLTHLFPSPQAIAEAHPDTLPGPRARRQTLQRLSWALASDELVIDAGSDRDEVRSHLLAIKGVGSWTADYIAMRALADPDVFLPTDLAVKRALAQLGQPTTTSHIAQLAQHWRPWRAYALQHLWATLAQ